MFAAGGATEATHAPLSGERPAVENHAAHASSGVAAVRVAVILRTGAPEMAAASDENCDAEPAFTTSLLFARAHRSEAALACPSCCFTIGAVIP